MSLSQAALARMAGISQQHLSLVESGRVRPNLRTLERILDALGMRLSLQAASAPAIARRIEGLSRFNSWEAGQRPRMSLDRALELSESMARLYADLHGRSEAAAHLSFQSQGWKDWRRRLGVLG